jgi:hypothetical protein
MLRGKTVQNCIAAHIDGDFVVFLIGARVKIGGEVSQNGSR